MTEGVATRLLQLDSCALSDALDSMQLPAAITGLAPLSSDRRIAGPAVTVRLAPDKPVDTAPRHLGTMAIESASGGEVIVIEHSSGVECAGWGGVLSAGARLRNIAGVVIDGLARDIDEARELAFPIFARGATARTARNRVWEQECNEPVNIAGTTVRPGDWIVADASGVVALPLEHLEEIIARAERVAARERLMVEALRKGERVTEVLGRSYEDMLQQLD